MDDAQDLIGQTILVKLTSNEGLAFAGVPADGPFFCRVTTVDEIGIWVENKNFVTMEIRNAAGHYIPKRKQEAAAQVLGDKVPSCGRIGFVKEGSRDS